MRGWGPAWIAISVRQLLANEADHVGVYDRRRRCTVSIGFFRPRDPQTGCSGDTVMPGHPNLCVSTQTTFVCAIDTGGGYGCSRYSDGAPPLRNKNATTDESGVLKLDVPLTGTHATPLLAWQRYPHVDSFIHPWTSAGKLRRGLTLGRDGPARYYHGKCFAGTEYTRDTAALRCESDVHFDPCYPPSAGWNRRGVVVACAVPGGTRFGRFVITRRS